MRSSPIGLLAVAVVVLAAAVLAAIQAERLDDGAPTAFGEVARLTRLPDYGANGSDVLGYAHGQSVELTVVLRNRGLLPVEVIDVDPLPARLGMLAVDSVVVDGAPLGSGVWLGPFARAEVEVVAHFDNCEYYTERAVDRYDGAAVTTRSAGLQRTERVAYGHQLLIRAPTILDCPARELDRSAKQRSEDATLRG